ncbi:putative receptor-type tyrosine-protein phosphatase F isoform X1 [Apostichopus japonicus]|uniref:Putative receptor-type tyrosine-protein phosphatase F isoform X1 n=1 Tax=Stichopus japonicus TaxID=307972 RepID=A0A2G8L8L6_STIJA|nr:putative receptor-type tyrosine-protein phosphatase F isoform X1 [Apostichopus japonicus]
MWSPPGCTNTCEPCINGGVCSDLTGLCLCPPGFSGNNCENIHGRNVFGQNAEYKCDDSGFENADGCQGAIICYPDPLGCFCPAGYKGLNCTSACERGKFGANCKQECHCANNSLCALDTGLCEDNQCEDGWRGTNCQLVDAPCLPGVYGDFCNLPCSCSDGGDACSEVEANCGHGCAVPWTGIACDEENGAGNIILTYVRVNPGQAANVTCTVIRNPLVAQSDLVLSPTGTLFTADEDARGYNQTKVVGITLEAGTEVTCSIRDTELMETIMLVPYVPGPPGTVTLTNRTETSMTIEWDKPVNLQGVIINYQLQYRPIQKSYDQQFDALEFGPKVEIANSGAHIVYQLTDLEPSTVYEIQLNSKTSAGEGEVVSITERTNLFTGLVPPFIPATIHGTETGTAVLILPALNQQYASGYYIRIKSELGQEQIKRSVDGVGNYDDNPGHYITAEVQKSEKEQSFTIGDGKEYGIYYNAPLSKDQEYQVFIGTGSKVGQDVSVVWSDPGLITEAKDANNAAFLVPTLTILAVVLLVTIVIGIILFRWYLRRKKSDPGATAAPSHVYARHIPLTTHGINAGDAEGDAYEVPKKTSFSALEKTGNCTESDGYSNGGYVEYEISNKERRK